MKKIGIIGSPGSGKTTIASGLFYFLKTLGKKVELVPELIKYKVYQKEKFGEDGFDIQNTIEQRKLEEAVEQASDIEFVICEAPLTNGFFYSQFYKKDEEWPLLKKIASKKINTYDLLIFVEHNKENNYESFGRKEDQTTSLKLEEFIKSKVKELDFTNEIIFVNQKTEIQFILDHVKMKI